LFRDLDIALTTFLKAADREVFPAFFKSEGAKGRRIKSSDYFALATEIGRYFITKVFTHYGYPSEYLELWLETLHVLEYLKTKCLTDEEIENFGFMVSELNLKAEIFLSFDHSSSSVMHQGNHITDIIDRHGCHNVISNFFFERMGGMSVKPLKHGSSFKNPTWTMFSRYLELRTCELEAIKRGSSNVVASARCSQYEAVIRSANPKQVPAAMSFGKRSMTVSMKGAGFGRKPKKAHIDMVDHFGTRGEHSLAGVRAENREFLEKNTLPLLDMAKKVVSEMVDINDINSKLWPFSELEARYKKARSEKAMHVWEPSGARTKPLSKAEQIMKTGWNMDTVTFYPHVDYNGIRFRAEYRDKRPNAKSQSCGVRVTSTALDGTVFSTYGKIQLIFSWRPFNHRDCPTYYFASCLFIDTTRSVQHKWGALSTVIDLCSSSNMNDRVILLSQIQHFNVFFIPVHGAEATAKTPATKRVYRIDAHYHVLKVPRNENLPSKYYDSKEDEEKEQKEDE